MLGKFMITTVFSLLAFSHAYGVTLKCDPMAGSDHYNFIFFGKGHYVCYDQDHRDFHMTIGNLGLGLKATYLTGVVLKCSANNDYFAERKRVGYSAGASFAVGLGVGAAPIITFPGNVCTMLTGSAFGIGVEASLMKLRVTPISPK